jgi:hypothetical protein
MRVEQEEPLVMSRAFQEEFAELGSHQCWGCGTRNEHGLQVKSYWDGEEGSAPGRRSRTIWGIRAS